MLLSNIEIKASTYIMNKAVKSSYTTGRPAVIKKPTALWGKEQSFILVTGCFSLFTGLQIGLHFSPEVIKR